MSVHSNHLDILLCQCIKTVLKRFPLKFSRFFNKPAGFRILILNIVPENMKDRNL